MTGPSLGCGTKGPLFGVGFGVGGDGESRNNGKCGGWLGERWREGVAGEGCLWTEGQVSCWIESCRSTIYLCVLRTSSHAYDVAGFCDLPIYKSPCSVHLTASVGLFRVATVHTASVHGIKKKGGVKHQAQIQCPFQTRSDRAGPS